MKQADGDNTRLSHFSHFYSQYNIIFNNGSVMSKPTRLHVDIYIVSKSNGGITGE